MNEMTVSLYDRYFVCWTQETAKRLRGGGRLTEADIEHVAEEIEGMGKRDRRAAFSRSAVLVAHLLKWKHQPNKRSRSWSANIQLQRTRLIRVVEESPSLRSYIGENRMAISSDGAIQAQAETGLELPEDCAFTFSEALDPEFLP